MSLFNLFKKKTKDIEVAYTETMEDYNDILTKLKEELVPKQLDAIEQANKALATYETKINSKGDVEKLKQEYIRHSKIKEQQKEERILGLLSDEDKKYIGYLVEQLVKANYTSYTYDPILVLSVDDDHEGNLRAVLQDKTTIFKQSPDRPDNYVEYASAIRSYILSLGIMAREDLYLERDTDKGIWIYVSEVYVTFDKEFRGNIEEYDALTQEDIDRLSNLDI